MLGALVTLAFASLVATEATPAPAAKVTYEVRAELTSTTGRAIGTSRIATPEGVEASIERADGDRSIKITATVNPAKEPGCHAARLKLAVSKPGPEGTRVRQEFTGTSLHCGSAAVPFEGFDPKAGLSADLRLTVSVTPK